MNHDIHVIVRTRYMSELQDLLQLGADEVIPEEFETSIEIFSRVLREYGVARDVIRRQVEVVRSDVYQMLRAPSLPHVQMSEIAEALAGASTETLVVGANSAARGKTISELKLRSKTGATVIAVVREGLMEINPGPELTIMGDDVLVLLGSPPQIDQALELLNAGEAAAV
jgi:CPA2 family monovalent cation:H+ antiporter-2